MLYFPGGGGGGGGINIDITFGQKQTEHLNSESRIGKKNKVKELWVEKRAERDDRLERQEGKKVKRKPPLVQIKPNPSLYAENLFLTSKQAT